MRRDLPTQAITVSQGLWVRALNNALGLLHQCVQLAVHQIGDGRPDQDMNQRRPLAEVEGEGVTGPQRFQGLGELPLGYDNKYTYSHIGYNLKLTDMQAAVGLAQLRKLPGFIEARRRNFHLLRAGLAELEEFFILPEATAGSEPSWFGFPIAVRPDAPFSRNQATRHLEDRKIATRLLFGGNLTRQPAYRDAKYRTVGELANTDFVMDRVFWIGVYPGITDSMVDYTLETLRALCAL